MTEKRCSACKKSRPRLEFNIRRSSGDGLQNVCRDCNRSRARRYYAENRQAHVRTIMARKAAQRAANLEVIGEYLLSHPCVDCGEPDPRVLDFDHRERELKTAEVMRLVQHGYSRARVMAEVEKCDIRCRNCHAKVTYSRQGMTWRQALVDRIERDSAEP